MATKQRGENQRGSGLVEIAQQAGMLGWHVFVDGMYDADIRPSKTAQDALRKAMREYPRIGQHKNLDYSYYTSGQVLKNPSQAQMLARVNPSQTKPFQITIAALNQLRETAQANADQFQQSYILFSDTSGKWRVEKFSGYHSGPMELFGPKVRKNPGTLRAIRKPSRKLNKQTHYDTGPKSGDKSRSKFVYVQEQRGAMWVSLAVVKDSDKGRKQAQQWAQVYHRKHPAHRLRIFV